MDHDIVLDGSWVHSGWTSLLPQQATPLHMLVATATDAELDGDLDLLVDELGSIWFEYFSGGLDCRVRWFHPDDVDDREVRRCARIARRECVAAFRKAGIRMPRTVRELAWVMADLGILTTDAGRSRWRWPEWPPLPEEVLPVSRAFRKAEDARRWSSMHADIAHEIIELLEDAPEDLSVLTSIEQMEERTGFPELSVRAGFEVLLHEGVATYSLSDGDALELSELARSDTFLAKLNVSALR